MVCLEKRRGDEGETSLLSTASSQREAEWEMLVSSFMEQYEAESSSREEHEAASGKVQTGC